VCPLLDKPGPVDGGLFDGEPARPQSFRKLRVGNVRPQEQHSGSDCCGELLRRASAHRSYEGIAAPIQPKRQGPHSFREELHSDRRREDEPVEGIKAPKNAVDDSPVFRRREGYGVDGYRIEPRPLQLPRKLLVPPLRARDHDGLDGRRLHGRFQVAQLLRIAAPPNWSISSARDIPKPTASVAAMFLFRNWPPSSEAIIPVRVMDMPPFVDAYAPTGNEQSPPTS